MRLLNLYYITLAIISFGSSAWSAGFDVIAHRGLSYYAPESTTAAYLMAQQTDAAGLEGDIQMTKDRQLVIFHDDTIENKSNAKQLFPGRTSYKVSEFTLNELRQLDFGSWFNKKFPKRARQEFKGLSIVTLDELVSIAQSAKKSLYVEFKKADQIEETIERTLISLIQSQSIYATGAPQLLTVYFQSFNLDVIKFLSQRVPKSERVYLTGPTTPRAKILEGAPFATVLSPFWLELSKDYFNPIVRHNLKKSIVSIAHSRGVKVIPWTLNNVEWISKYRRILSIDGVFTDRASDLPATLNESKNSLAQAKDESCATPYLNR